jgi:hypothetical protein
LSPTEGGMGRALLHTLSQGVLDGIGGGNLTAALEAGGGAFLASMLAPRLNDAIKESLKYAGLDPKTNAVLASLLSEILTTALASSFGGIAGATAASVDMNNRQLHTPKEAPAGTCEETVKTNCVVDSIKECDGNGENCKYKPSFEGGISVGGKTYSDYAYIPGYEPVPVLNPDGSQMREPNGDPIYRPSGSKTLQQIGEDAKNTSSLGWYPYLGSAHGHNGRYDYQRLRDDNGGVVFMHDYTAYANIAIGSSFAAAGGTGEDAATWSNRFAFLFSNFGKAEMDKTYTKLPVINVNYYRMGANYINAINNKGIK